MTQRGALIAEDRYGGVFVDGGKGGALWLCVLGREERLTPQEVMGITFALKTTTRGDLLIHSLGPWDEDGEARTFWQAGGPVWIGWGPGPNEALVHACSRYDGVRTPTPEQEQVS